MDINHHNPDKEIKSKNPFTKKHYETCHSIIISTCNKTEFTRKYFFHKRFANEIKAMDYFP